jgi:hypothetical protein
LAVELVTIVRDVRRINPAVELMFVLSRLVSQIAQVAPPDAPVKNSESPRGSKPTR